MSISKDIIETEVRFTSNQAMAELKKLESQTASLRRENERLKTQKLKLEVQNKKDTEEYRRLTSRISENSKTLKENGSRMATLRKSIGITAMSMKDLRKEARVLQGQLDGTSKAANPKEYNRLEKELGQVKNQMGQLRSNTNNAQKIMRTFGAILPIAGVGLLLAKLKDLGKEMFNLAKSMQTEVRKNAIVLGDSLGYVEEQADKLARRIGVTNHEFTSMVANTSDLLVPLGFARDRAAEMSVQVQSLAGAFDEWTKGQYGVVDASDTLNAAMLGEMERLKKYGIAIRQDSEEFKNLVEQKYAEGAATDAQAKAMATLELILNKSRDAQASFNTEGNRLIRGQKDVARGFRRMKERVVEYFAEKPHEALDRQRKSVNLLVAELSHANTSEERRVEILEQLNTMAPDIVKTISDEGQVTKETTIALREYNKELINKMILSRKDQQVDAQFDKVSGVGFKLEEEIGKISEAIDRRRDKIKDLTELQKFDDIWLNKELSFTEKADKLSESGFWNRYSKSADPNFSGYETDKLDKVEAFQKMYEKQNGKYQELIDQRKALINRLFDGQEPGSSGNGNGGGGGGGGGGNEPTRAQDPMAQIQSKQPEQVQTQEQFNKQIVQLDQKRIDELLNMADVFAQEKKNMITQDLLDGKITQEQYNQQMEDLEMAHLLTLLETRRALGMDTLDLETELLNKKKALMDQESQVRQQHLQETAQAYQGFISQVTGGLYDMAAGGEGAMRSFAKNMINMALDMLSQQVQLAIAGVTVQSLAMPDSVATLGATGLARAAIQVGMIEAAFQVVKGLANRGVDSYFDKKEGKYYTGGYTPPGLWDQPQGVVHSNEWVGSRYAVGNPDVRQFLDVFDLAQRSGQVNSLNTEAILRAVEIKRGGFASGGFSAPADISPSGQISPAPELMSMLTASTQATIALSHQIAKGIKAKVVYQDIEDANAEMTVIRSKTNITQS